MCGSFFGSFGLSFGETRWQVLHVPTRQGEEVMRAIRNAMEENQMQAMIRV